MNKENAMSNCANLTNTESAFSTLSERLFPRFYSISRICRGVQRLRISKISKISASGGEIKFNRQRGKRSPAGGGKNQ